MIDVEVLKKYVGTKFKMKDERGNALACALPLYLLNPNLTKVKFEDLKDNHFKNVWDLLQKNFKQVNLDEIQTGDVIAIQLPIYKTLHLAVYMGNSKIFHCLNIQDGVAEICNVSFFEKHIRGCFRWVFCQ